MSNLFPKYKKSHTLQTALPVKNSFSFRFPLIFPQPSPPSEHSLAETPSPHTHADAQGLLCPRASESVSPGNPVAILAALQR